ncbi:MAG: hypothetical protein LBB27_03010 [Tannerellaceae bacterium]|jgi:hypothetical protein|nr:hypothetical protein [Tannerellaceae bacterium]
MSDSVISGAEREFRAGDTVGRSKILYILDNGDVVMRCNVCCTVYDTTLDVLRKGETDTCGDCKPYESGLRTKTPEDSVPRKRYNYAGTGLSVGEIAKQFKVSNALVYVRYKAYVTSEECREGIRFLDYFVANLYKQRNCPRNGYVVRKRLNEEQTFQKRQSRNNLVLSNINVRLSLAQVAEKSLEVYSILRALSERAIFTDLSMIGDMYDFARQQFPTTRYGDTVFVFVIVFLYDPSVLMGKILKRKGLRAVLTKVTGRNAPSAISMEVRRGVNFYAKYKDFAEEATRLNDAILSYFSPPVENLSPRPTNT